MQSKITAKQIIQDIDRRYPNTYTENDKITWINDTLRQIYTDIAVKAFYKFSTIKGRNLYTLPADCEIANVKSVEMSEKAKTGSNDDLGNFKELRFSLRDKYMYKPSYYDGLAGLIGLYPTPNASGHVINVYYNKRPKMITSLDDYIELDERYVNLVTYNVISIIAMSGHNPDIDVANEYILLYNNLVQDANQTRFEDQPTYPVIKEARRALLKYRRRR